MLEIIWNNNSFYLFDSHTRNFSGNPANEGTAILLKLNLLLYFDEYIRKMYLEKQPIFTYFQVQFIRAVCFVEDISNIQADPNNISENTGKIVYLKECKQKMYHENSLTILSKKRKSHAGNSRLDWVNKFRKQIFEGQSFICTICHRYLYLQSVQKFIETKYEWDKNKNYAQAGFDGNFYICSTCHNNVRRKIPLSKQFVIKYLIKLSQNSYIV